MKLLIPVDGSQASVSAAKKAAEIAKKDGYTVKIISVIKPDDLQAYRRNAKAWQQLDGSLIGNRAKPIDDEEALVKMRRRTNDIIDSVLSEAAFEGIQTERAVLVGEPFEVILDTAKKEGVDLIVMGNRGFSKIKRFFVGSVTQKVIAEAPCPVLVVHSDAEESGI